MARQHNRLYQAREVAQLRPSQKHKKRQKVKEKMAKMHSQR
jgi:hypothetical protein